MTTPRIDPAEPPHPPELAEELARWMPPGAPIEPLALFRTLGRNLPLARAMRELGRLLLSRRLSLSLREREIVIHRVCARCDCAYEWGVHAASFGPKAGLGREALTATVAAGPEAWSGREALLIRLVDELHDSARVSNPLWTALAGHYGPETLLELLVLVGWYHGIAFVANGARVAGEPWAVPFPERAGCEADAPRSGHPDAPRPG